MQYQNPWDRYKMNRTRCLHKIENLNNIICFPRTNNSLEATTMNAMHEAVMVSNQGARLLSFGNIEGALKSFQHAVITMKNFTHQNGGPPKAFDMVALSASPIEGTPETRVQEGVCYVYDRPLLIPTDLNANTQHELDSLVRTVSTYVIFNFALAFHQLGRISGQDAPLRQAAELYNTSFKILSRCCGDDNLNSKMNATLQCLVLNNLAHLHYDHCEYEKSRSCMDCMYDLIMFTECLDSSSFCFLESKEIEEISLNLMYMKPPMAAPVA